MAGGVTGGAAGTWSDRFEQGLHPFIEAFNASIGFDLTLLQEDLDGSIAHARMLAGAGVITEAEAEQLVQGLETVRAEAASGSFQPGLADEDVHFAVERRLIALLGPVGKKLHTGRSRNDQVGTDLRLWLRRRLDGLDQDLQRLQGALLTQADRHRRTMIPGYTHLQRAQPLCLAHHLLAYVEMLERDRERLQDVRKRVNICPLGAAALAGTPVPIDRQRTAKELGFSAVYANSLDAVSDRDFCVEFSAAASLVMVHLSRLAEEVIAWASEEFGFVRLSDRCATGSSLMPQKKNPDVPELVRGKSGRVFGHLQGLLTMIKGLPLASTRIFRKTRRRCLMPSAQRGIALRPWRFCLRKALISEWSASIKRWSRTSPMQPMWPTIWCLEVFHFARLINWWVLSSGAVSNRVVYCVTSISRLGRNFTRPLKLICMMPWLPVPLWLPDAVKGEQDLSVLMNSFSSGYSVSTEVKRWDDSPA